MPTDASILLGLKPMQTTNPMEMYEAGQRIETNRLAGIMNGLKMDEYQRSVQDAESQRGIVKGFGADTAANANMLMQGGHLKAAQDYAKSAAEQTKFKDDSAKTQSEVLDKNLNSFRSVVPQINSPEMAGQYTAAMYDHPVLGKFAANFGSRDDAIKRNMEAFTKDPRAWTTGAAGMTADKLIEMMKGTRQNTNVGGNSQGQTIDYYGGVVPGQTTNTPITQSADNKAIVGQRQDAADAAATQKTQPKPIPSTALKMQQEGLDAIGTSSSINADLNAIKTQIDTGKLKFGPIGNLANKALNFSGNSTEESRNFASFTANMEKLRNDSLRLNKGVQTDGDAVRAWNELFNNINDTKVVSQRLAEIDRLNTRAVELRKLDIDNIRSNYGHESMDYAKYEKQPTALNGGASGSVKPDAAGMEAEMRKRGLIK